MRHKTKLHAIAIGSICFVITVLYLLIGPSTPAGSDGMANGDRYVQIYQATWGLNCNQAITAAKRQQAMTALQPNAETYETVTPNNVLPALSHLCDGRLVCTFPLTKETMGYDPISSCYKKFTASYRCFETDRLWKIESDQGDTVTIDCNPAADKDRKF